jgi:hypothetical protein
MAIGAIFDFHGATNEQYDEVCRALNGGQPFPFDSPGARAQALVHAPAAFRRRGVFVADYEIDAA